MLLLSPRRKKRRITIDVGFCHQIIGYKYVLYIYFHDYFVLNLLHRFVFVFAQTCRIFGGSELWPETNETNRNVKNVYIIWWLCYIKVVVLASVNGTNSLKSNLNAVRIEFSHIFFIDSMLCSRLGSLQSFHLTERKKNKSLWNYYCSDACAIRSSNADFCFNWFILHFLNFQLRAGDSCAILKAQRFCEN